MLKCFKSTMISYLLLCYIGGFSIYLILSRTINSRAGWTFAIIWIFFVASILEIIARIKMKKVVNIMIDDCNLEKYIHICNDLFFEQVNKKYKIYLMLNLATGYLNAGDKERAEKILNNVYGFGNGRVGTTYLAIYYNILVAYYFQTKDIENVVDSMNELKIILNNKKMNRKSRTKLLYLYSEAECLLNMENNNYDGAEQIFNDSLVREKHMLGKVSTKYTLGLIYLHYNRLSEATEAFEFAVKNGGTSRFVEISKEHLEKLNLEEL